MRRLFWFMLGAMSGVAVYVKVKSLLGEAREAMTVRNVLGALRALLAALWSTVSGRVVGLLGSRSSSDMDVSGTRGEGPARRHLATRQRSPHG